LQMHEAPVLVGTIFYAGQKLLRGGRRSFDRKAAAELVARQERLAELTGLSCMLDLVLLSPGEVSPYIDFVAEVTEVPFAAGAAKSELRLKAARYVAELGLQERYLHSSLSFFSGDPAQEAGMLAELGVRSTILLAHPEYGSRLEQAKRLVELARTAGMRGLMADLGVVHIGELREVLEEGRRIRHELGVSVGCAPANATHMLREKVESLWGSSGFAGFDSAVHALAALHCDFVMYGAIEHARWIFPAVAGVMLFSPP